MIDIQYYLFLGRWLWSSYFLTWCSLWLFGNYLVCCQKQWMLSIISCL